MWGHAQQLKIKRSKRSTFRPESNSLPGLVFGGQHLETPKEQKEEAKRKTLETRKGHNKNRQGAEQRPLMCPLFLRENLSHFR